jgi:hypothetical protein
MEEVSQEVLGILKDYYKVPEEDFIEMMPYDEAFERGFGCPSDKGVHLLHFPEHRGFYYMIKCRGPEECPICNW